MVNIWRRKSQNRFCSERGLGRFFVSCVLNYKFKNKAFHHRRIRSCKMGLEKTCLYPRRRQFDLSISAFQHRSGKLNWDLNASRHSSGESLSLMSKEQRRCDGVWFEHRTSSPLVAEEWDAFKEVAADRVEYTLDCVEREVRLSIRSTGDGLESPISNFRWSSKFWTFL